MIVAQSNAAINGIKTQILPTISRRMKITLIVICVRSFLESSLSITSLIFLNLYKSKFQLAPTPIFIK
jgi:hypothetical protein